MNKRKCRHCKQYFDRTVGIIVPVGFFCSIEHAREYAKPKAKVIQTKQAKAQLQARKVALKPKSKLLSEAQAAVNKYVRLRDAHLGCVSCDKPANWSGQWHASHFHSRGHSSSLRFNLWNIHKSCSVCNNYLSGNVGAYLPELINRIGQDKVDWMESVKSQPAIHTIEYLNRLKKVFNKKSRLLEKRLLKQAA